jgi:hypothetical protein
MVKKCYIYLPRYTGTGNALLFKHDSLWMPSGSKKEFESIKEAKIWAKAHGRKIRGVI